MRHIVRRSGKYPGGCKQNAGNMPGEADSVSFRNKEKEEGLGQAAKDTGTGGDYMGLEEKDLQKRDKKLEQVNEMLSDALSLIILLENDMETQKADGIHTRTLRMVHNTLKGIQRNLSEYIRQREK